MGRRPATASFASGSGVPPYFSIWLEADCPAGFVYSAEQLGSYAPSLVFFNVVCELPADSASFGRAMAVNSLEPKGSWGRLVGTSLKWQPVAWVAVARSNMMATKVATKTCLPASPTHKHQTQHRDTSCDKNEPHRRLLFAAWVSDIGHALLVGRFCAPAFCRPTLSATLCRICVCVHFCASTLRSLLCHICVSHFV